MRLDTLQSPLTPLAPEQSEPVAVAKIVFDGMPGEGVGRIVKGEQLTPTAWTSLADAISGTEELTAGNEVGAAGIFRRNGKFEAFALDITGIAFQPFRYHATGDENIARTLAGRGLVQIVDGGTDQSIMSAKDFRRYESYADGE